MVTVKRQLSNEMERQVFEGYPPPLRFHTDRPPSQGIEAQNRQLHQARLAMNDLIMSHIYEAIR